MTPRSVLCWAGVALIVVWGAPAYGQEPGTVRLPDDSAATRKYGPVLRLHVESAGTAADTIALSYVLTNAGHDSVTLCIGRGHGYTVSTPADTVRPWVLIDHESCAQTTALASGAAIRWSWPFVPPAITGAPVTLSAWVNVVDPTDCGIFGCARAIVESVPVPLLLKPRRP